MAEEPLKERPASSSPADIGLPEIPGYRIEETLGRGATGVVYRATQLAVDRQVALKVLHPDLAGRPRAVRRLQREARTAARLAHPNIVSAIDMGQVGPLWWYAMELVVGESLAARLKRVGRLTEREALRFFTPLVDALDHAFRQGVVHRDIKPANILIDKDGRARLVDLGLAFREDDPLITNPGSTLGTPHYVSPEQARNPGQADTRSDIWSLGATFYHALCGRPPFSGESVAEILSGVLYGRVTEPRELVPGLSRSISLVLRKCLARDPSGRYQSPHDLLEDLERCREKRAVLVQPSALDPVRNDRPWRTRAPWIAAGALGIVGLAAWLARDVLAPTASSGAPEVTAAEPWAELEELAAAAERPGARPAPLLVDLAALGPVTSRNKARYEAVEERLVNSLREAQDLFTRRLGAEVDRLVGRRDFKGALALLSSEGFEARAREELEVDSAQLRQLESRARPQELRGRVLRELAMWTADLSANVEEHVTKVLGLRVENDKAVGHWRSAFEQLSIEPAELLKSAGLVVAGLPDERVETLEAGLREELKRRLNELAAAWTKLDGELADWVHAAARQLEGDLQTRRLQGSAVEELERRYRHRSDELHLTPDEELIQISSLAAQAFAKESAHLLELERSLLEEDARVWLADADRQAEDLQRQRRYGELAELWKRGLERDWLAPVHDQVEMKLRAAELVDDLFQRAARGVLELDNQRVAVLKGSIQVEGLLRAGPAPLDAGFSLESSALGKVALALRPVEASNGSGTPFVLAPDVVERFAGLTSSIEVTPDPIDKLARALLRYNEGDIEAALQALPLTTGDPLLDTLASRLFNEASRKSGELRAQSEQRASEATKQANLVLRLASEAVEPAERDAAVRAIETLLASWSSTQPRELEAELKKRRDELRSRQAPDADDFHERFGPTKVVLDGGQVELDFHFGAGYQGAWSAGEWVAEEKGWIARSESARESLRSYAGWPRLDLGPPIDLDAPLELSLTFELPADTPASQLVVVSVAGVNVALRSDQGSERARVQVTSGGAEGLRGLLEQIERSGRGSTPTFAGFVRGQEYTLSIELSKKRTQAVVRLWGKDANRILSGETIADPQLPRTPERASSSSVVVRSLNPVRLLEAKLRARAVPFY